MLLRIGRGAEPSRGSTTTYKSMEKPNLVIVQTDEEHQPRDCNDSYNKQVDRVIKHVWNHVRLQTTKLCQQQEVRRQLFAPTRKAALCPMKKAAFGR
jgi:hypothetical protein